MPQAKGSLRQIAFIPEVTFGTTPGTPQTQVLEFVDFKGSNTAAVVNDPSINAFRQKTFSRRGNATVGAELDVVLRPDNSDAFLEAGTLGTWTTNVLKVGTLATAVRKSFAIEEGFTDLAQFQTYNGMVVDTFNLGFGTDGLVTAKFGFIGKSVNAFYGTSIDITPTPVTAKDPFFHDGGTFQIGGSTVGWITSLEVNVANGYEAKYGLGSSLAADIPFANTSVTGKVTGMFDTITEFTKYKAGTSSSLSALVVAGAESLTVSVPQIKYTSGNIVSSGDAGIMVEFEFEAEYNVAQASSLVITRV